MPQFNHRLSARAAADRACQKRGPPPSPQLCSRTEQVSSDGAVPNSALLLSRDPEASLMVLIVCHRYAVRGDVAYLHRLSSLIMILWSVIIRLQLKRVAIL